MEVFPWLGQHWLVLLQSTGIVGGLIFTGLSLRIDARVRRVGNLLAVTREHRDLWTELNKQPELWRVLDAKVDLRKAPPTPEEELFVNLAILHLASVHEAMKNAMFVNVPGLRKDIRHFFSLPIPKQVWKEMQPFQDIEFVDFVEACCRD